MSEPRQGAKQEAPPKDTRSTDQRIADLELALVQSRATAPGGTLPDHTAGPGQDKEETWSLAQQEAAQAEANE